MSLIQASFHSPILAKAVQMNVILPSAGRGPFPVFYLLHGLSDDYSMWQRRTAIERYVENLPLIVAMPDGFRGFYTDNAAGPEYGRYMVEDVIGFVERTFPVRATRASRCIGGLSMGGYGALRLALEHPELFVSATSHSAPCEAGHRSRRTDVAEYRAIFGARPAGSAHDLFALASKLKRRGTRFPKLRIDCGVSDSLLQENRRFAAHLKKLKAPHTYLEFPGAHTWQYWDEHVREALAFHAQALRL